MNTNTQQPLSGNPASHSESPPVGGHRWPNRGVLWRRALLIMLVAAVLAAVRWLAYQLRFDFDVPREWQLQLANNWCWVIALQLVCLLLADQFSGIYRYFSIPDVLRLAYAMLVS